MASRKARNPFNSPSPSPPPPQQQQQSGNGGGFDISNLFSKFKNLSSAFAPKVPRRGTGRGPFVVSPSPPPPDPQPNATQDQAIQQAELPPPFQRQDPAIQHVESLPFQRSRSTTVETDPMAFDLDEFNKGSSSTAVHKRTAGDDKQNDESPLAVPSPSSSSMTITEGEGEDDDASKTGSKPEIELIPPPVSAGHGSPSFSKSHEDLRLVVEKSPPTTDTDFRQIFSAEEPTARTTEPEHLLCDQNEPQPNILIDSSTPLSSATLADPTDVNASVSRERSRSIETNQSLFGSPAPQEPSANGPDTEDVEDADAMSISSASSTQTFAQIGVQWTTAEFDYFNPYPEWSCEPEADEVVEMLKQEVSPLLEYKVSFLHKSAYNRFFEVEWDDKSYVMKVTIPVCPVRKTESEVATMRWTKTMTPLPLPDVVQNLYSSSANNPIGCEWILMRKLPGRPLFDCWHDMDMPRKQRVVEQIADYTVHAFKIELDGIASLYPAASGDPDRRPELSGMAAMPFFWNGRHYKKRQYGPYETYREWAFDRLDLAYADAESVLPKLRNAEIRRIPWRIQAVIAKLKDLHDMLFPSSRGAAAAPAAAAKEKEDKEEPKGATKDQPIDLTSDDEDNNDGDNNTVAEADAADNNSHEKGDDNQLFDCEETTMLWHTNLSADNIFVDDTGVITGVLDWECVSAIPRSVACQLPAFLLDGHDRHEEPRVEHYWTFSETLSPSPSSPFPSPSPSPSPGNDDDDDDDDDNDDEMDGERGRTRKRQKRCVSAGPTPEYWRARREWELTELRRHFLMIMADRSLGWHMCHKHHALKRDFEAAVQYCDDPLLLGVVEEWVDAVEAALSRERSESDGDGGGVEGVVWSLERRVAKGPRVPAGHNQRT